MSQQQRFMTRMLPYEGQIILGSKSFGSIGPRRISFRLVKVQENCCQPEPASSIFEFRDTLQGPSNTS
jgi:hypothetical protein